MVIFWSHGYNGTSLQDLVGTMGINRASLYDTFNDKYSLFLDSLYIYMLLETNEKAMFGAYLDNPIMLLQHT